MNDITAADIAAMRKQGDLAEFFRQQIASARSEPPVNPLSEPERDLGYRPGVWPAGTRPPTPLAPVGASEDWQRALDEYRRWHHSGEPQQPGGFTCECGACPTSREGSAL